MTRSDPAISYPLIEQTLDTSRNWMMGRKATPSVRLIYRIAAWLFRQCLKKDAEIATLRQQLGIEDKPKWTTKVGI